MKLAKFTHTMFGRFLLSLMFILALLIALVSYALYHSFQQVTLKSVSDSSAKSLLQTSYGANYMNDDARNFTLSIFSSPNTDALMYNAEDAGVTELMMEMDRIQTLVKANSFVHSVYVYNKKLHRFLSTNNNMFNDEDVFEDKAVVYMMQNPDANLRLKPIQRTIENSLTFPKEEKVLTYVIYDNFSLAGGVDGAVIVNIYSDYLQNLITSFNMGNPLMNGDTFIVDQQSQLLSDNPKFSTAEIKAIMHPILQQTNKTGYMSATLKGEEVLVTYTASDVLKWWFVHVEPYSIILKSTEHLKRTTLLISFGLFVFGLLLSLFISRRFYSPFGKLLGRAKGLIESPVPNERNVYNEVGLLDIAVSEAYKLKQNALQRQRNEALKSLFSSPELSVEKLQVLFKKHNIPLKLDEQYLLLGYRIDHYNQFVTEFSERDRELIRYTINNAASETVGQHFSNYVIDMGEDLLVHIVNVGSMDEPAIHKLLTQAVDELQAWCIPNLKLSISAAIGQREVDFKNLQTSYQKLVKLSSYRLVYGHGSLMFSNLLEERKADDSFKIAQAEEQQFHEALVSGRIEEVRTIYEAIMSKVVQQSYDAIMSNVLYLFYYVHNTMHVMERNSVDKYQLDFHAYLRQMSQVETIQEVDDLFHGIFAEIANAITSRKNNRSSILVDSIIKYIEIHYRNPGLCLESVAEEMNLSKMYVGKLFREACGQSVADYIIDIRMRKAIELLNEDSKNRTLVDLLDEVGVENKKYFYILFKKKMGVSFSDYRLKHLNLVNVEEDKQ